MNVWRLTRPQYAATALSGEGSARYPGRWNVRGVRVAYASETLSLALLEVLAHAENLDMLNQYVVLQVTLPSGNLTTLTPDELPKDWQADPPPESTRRLGHAWFIRKGTLVLKVPSVLVPTEHNFVINPEHPNLPKIAVAEPVPLPFDARVLRVVGL